MLLSGFSRVDSFAQFLTVLLIFLLVLGVTYFVTRYIGKYQKTQTTGRNIEVIEATKISPQAFVEILKVGSKYIAVAVSKDNVTYLCDVPAEEIIVSEEGDIVPQSFNKIFDIVRKNNLTSSEDIRSDGKDE